jgi:hypothetical protein
MTYNNEPDPLRTPHDPLTPRRPTAYGGWLPLAFAAAVVLAIIALMYPRTTPDRTGDTTNAGPSVQTVTPAPSPTTEPRPTQVPQP